MTSKLLISIRLLAFAAPLVFINATHAQQPAAPAAASAATAAAETGDESAATDASIKLPPGALPDNSPAVRTALEMPRKTPADAFRAIALLIDLGRPDLAKPILDELKALQLTDEQRAEIVARFGSQRLLKLARAKELAPDGGAFAEACMTSAATLANDPGRVTGLLAKLSDPSAEVRQAARNDLAATGQTGVVATLQALAQERNPDRRDALVAAAAQMAPLVNGPLLAMLDTQDPALLGNVIDLVRQLQITQAAPLLVALSTDSQAAERTLTMALKRYAAGTPPFAIDEQDQVELWHWDDATKSLTARRYPADDARTIWMARLARELARLRPDLSAYQRQSLLLNLEAIGLMNPPASAATAAINKSPAAVELLSSADNHTLNQVLAEALAANYSHAATAAADALGQRGDAGVLYTSEGKFSPLAQALESASPRVRFAALRAIMTLDPQSPYPGSSRVPDALGWFAGSSGERHAIVAMPTLAAGSDIAGKLTTAGIDADAVNRGRDAVDSALKRADLEFILVDMNIMVPEVRQGLFELRASPTTGLIPIALLAADGRFEAAQRLAEEHQRVIAVPRPHSPEAVAQIAQRLTALASRDAIPTNERAAQAVQAITWLGELLEKNRSFYNLRRETPAIQAALQQADAIRPALAALGRLGTPESQQTLVNFASQPSLPIEARSQAAAAFRDNVAAHGVLLTEPEILRQYERHNASAGADADTQKVLGSLLDAIESRRSVNPAATIPSP